MQMFTQCLMGWADITCLVYFRSNIFIGNHRSSIQFVTSVLPLNLNLLCVFIYLTLCYHSGGFHLSDKREGLFKEMSKWPPLSSLNPSLDYCHTVKRVFLQRSLYKSDEQLQCTEERNLPRLGR